jgi:pantoate--beta-alanine ligase
MTAALVALGSNLGDRRENLRRAVEQLAATPGVRVVAHSRWRETSPVGGPPDQGNFFNGAALLETTLEPAELLAALLAIERALGRERRERWGPRTLDLDLLLYGDEVINTPQLTVPHPRMAERRFVLEPAAEVAPQLVHPINSQTVGRMCQTLLSSPQSSSQSQMTPGSTPPIVVTAGEEIRRRVRAWRAAGETVGLVPTMGALHAGHLSLVARSVAECRHTVVTIFVNPTQFGPNEDFQRYPRQLDRDLELLAASGAELVFAPTTEAMYPEGFATHVDVEQVTRLWEGAIRPSHFRGVATVVLKLFNFAPADVAYFGQKDFQQSVVVRRMVADLNLPIEIRVCPIVREPDGLALSSRNAFLSADQRRQALVLSQSVRKAVELAAAGERDAAKIAGVMRQMIEAIGGVRLDYAAVVHPRSLEEASHVEPGVVAIVAAKVGSTRLIDNEILLPELP